MMRFTARTPFCGSANPVPLHLPRYERLGDKLRDHARAAGTERGSCCDLALTGRGSRIDQTATFRATTTSNIVIIS